MKQRERNLVVRLDDAELAMARKIAEQRDEPFSRVVRAFIRETYAAMTEEATKRKK